MLFADGAEASRFVEIIRDVKERDQLAVLAWCVMGNHYHLAVRTAAVLLWRSIRLIQWRYARQHNRQRRQLGPVWQGRYQVRLVERQAYLLQLIAYIHLNPVSAGLVEDPSDYRWSGHRELAGRSERPLADVAETLELFGESRAKARRSYVRFVRGERASEWLGEQPGRLPWWGGVGGQSEDDEGEAATERHGTGPVAERWHVRDVDRYVATAAGLLGVEVAGLAGRGKEREIVRAREILAIVGVERLGVKVKDLAARL